MRIAAASQNSTALILRCRLRRKRKDERSFI
jgi:hypothetical protein